MSTQPTANTLHVPDWTFADRLRKARRETGMTQVQMAAAIGVDPKRYAQWELDANLPRNIVEIANAVQTVTGVSAGWLLGVDRLTVPYGGGRFRFVPHGSLPNAA